MFGVREGIYIMFGCIVNCVWSIVWYVVVFVGFGRLVLSFWVRL